MRRNTDPDGEVNSPLGWRKVLLSIEVDRPRDQKLSGLGWINTEKPCRSFSDPSCMGMLLTTSARHALIIEGGWECVKQAGMGKQREGGGGIATEGNHVSSYPRL